MLPPPPSVFFTSDNDEIDAIKKYYDTKVEI